MILAAFSKARSKAFSLRSGSMTGLLHVQDSQAAAAAIPAVKAL
jgi:hypothetical protein